jgi:SAM-dependent methyltransferase
VGSRVIVSTRRCGVPAKIRARLQAGELVDDRIFDEVYPHALRRISHMHWTPIEAAVRAARLLDCRPGARVLDIGSGVGKFCIVAAASTRARVLGIERRQGLVDVAERTAATFGVDVAFVHGSFASHDPRAVDGVYLFNPFVENICCAEDRIDATVELSEARFVEDVAAVEEFLGAARTGTRVVTYCGFGGDMPSGYVRVLRERCAGVLELWIKTDDP